MFLLGVLFICALYLLILNRCSSKKYVLGKTTIETTEVTNQRIISGTTSCFVETLGGDPNNDMYGAWPVCTNIIPKNPLVYSFGIGSDVTFDIDLKQRFNASVFCFDPTIESTTFEQIRKNATGLLFKQFGLGHDDEVINFYRSNDPKIGSLVSTPGLQGYQRNPHLRAPVLKLSTLLAIYKHSWVDLIKMDIEGGEYNVLGGVNLVALPASQVLVEFHSRFFPDGWRMQKELTQKFEKSGWKLAHESKNKEEVVFIRI